MGTHRKHTNSVEDGSRRDAGHGAAEEVKLGILRAGKVFRKDLSASEIQQEGWSGRQKPHPRGAGTLERCRRVLSRGSHKQICLDAVWEISGRRKMNEGRSGGRLLG